MNRPKYKELYLKEKGKTKELNGVLKQYRNTITSLIGQTITSFKKMRSPYSFDDLDVINSKDDKNFYVHWITRERVEEDE